MNGMRRVHTAVFLVALCLWAGCSESESEPASGTITASASSIQDQEGSAFAVYVYDFDWSPGSPNDIVGILRGNITSASFSVNGVVQSLSGTFDPSGQPKTFDPGTYSVVFFVAPAGSAPQHFVEVRVEVDGDVTASAPGWAGWTHM